jgi:hypothetical protein
VEVCTSRTVTVTTKPTSPIIAPRIAESTDVAVDGVKVSSAGMSTLASAAPHASAPPASAPSSGTSHRLWQTLSRHRKRVARVMSRAPLRRPS